MNLTLAGLDAHEAFGLFEVWAAAMRAKGATAFKAGDFSCVWGKSPVVLASLPQETVPDHVDSDMADAEAQARYEADLFWSSEG